jgi:hypothetical protein
MELKQEFLKVLESGRGHEPLLEFAHRCQAHGVTAEKCYQALEQIWLDLGFDDPEKESSLRDSLEYAMEKLWYQETNAT